MFLQLLDRTGLPPILPLLLWLRLALVEVDVLPQ
jgi:hypothetical protein